MSLTSSVTAPSILDSIVAPAFGRVSAAGKKTMGNENDTSYWNKIRSDFPITENLIYMNNGTMGPSPRVVTERVTSRIVHVDSTGDYNGDYEGLRKAIAGVLGAKPDGSEIAFTHNVSEAISIVSSGMALKQGDEVLMTDQEHGGNAVAWLARKKRDGIVLKFITLVPSDDEIVERFKQAITPRTKAIAIPHVTCTTGQVLPIKRITELAHARGIRVMADGAHPPGMMQVNVKDLGVDAYTSCGHKWLCGPKGIGFLYITDEFMHEVIPTWSGAEADKHWDYQGNLEFLPTASRYDFATQNFALFDGLHAAINYMNAIGLDKIEARVKHLTKYLRNGLEQINGNRFDFLTPASSVTGLTTIKLRHKEYKAFAENLITTHKVRTRIVPESDLDANRFSVHIYTSERDIDTFLGAVKESL